jgi:pyridoxamine 5'-phosphate oxidase
VYGQRERLGRWQAGLELVVDEQPPHVAERHAADELGDVHPSVPQGTAGAVRFRDLRLDGDDAFETRDVLGHRGPPRSDHPARCAGPADATRRRGHTGAVPATPDPLVPALAAARVSYEVAALDETDLAPTPLAQFRRWYDEAVAARLPEPNAMVLATAGERGGPSARTVLLKQADGRGFVFYTNHGSRKAAELAAGRAAVLFPWHPLQRQVGVRGLVQPVSREESAAYFAGRPWGSRIGAWASRQSQPVSSRAELEARWAELGRRYPDRGRPDDVPLPPFWGGFVLRPDEVEFWQGRPSRLHDRLVFVSTSGAPPPLDDPAGWRVERREP